MRKICEIVYPYVFPIPVVVFLKHMNISLMNSDNLNSSLDAIITVSSLIIGFIGAILPVILSMKNDSKLVKYVFEKDKDRLFLKYIKQTLITGILLIVVAVSVYFRDQYSGYAYFNSAIYCVVYILGCFLLCTYRCLDNMLNILFSEDNDLKNDDSFSVKSEREKKFIEKADKKQNDE